MAEFEKVSPDTYPGLNWSSRYTHEDGDPADTLGLIGFISRAKRIRMDFDHQLKITTPGPDMDETVLIFGLADIRKITVYSTEKLLFSLEDTQRIEEIGEGSRRLIVTMRQMETARKVVSLGERLLENLRSIEIDDPTAIQEAGIIEGFVRTQKERLLPNNAIAVATKLKDLGVKSVSAGGSNNDTWEPDYLIELFSSPNQEEQAA